MIDRRSPAAIAVPSPVYAGDLPMKARHFTGDLPELLGIDGQRKLPVGRFLVAGQQAVALFGVEPEPVKFYRQGRSCFPPSPEIGKKLLDLHSELLAFA